MDNNKDLEKVSRTVFDNFKMDAPENAWNKLDAELDKKQARVYMQRANRFKLLSLLLLLIIFSFTVLHYLNPTSSSDKMVNAIVKNNATYKNTTSISIEPKSNSTFNVLSSNTISSKNKNKLQQYQQKKQLSKPIQQQNTSLDFAINTKKNNIKTRTISYSKMNNITNALNFSTKIIESAPESNSANKNSDLNTIEIIQQSNSTPTNSVSNETVNVQNDSEQTNLTEQNNTSATNSDHKSSTLIDIGASKLADFENKDSLKKLDAPPNSRLSIAVFYSPNKSWSNLKDNTNNNFDDVSMYNNRENSTFSFTSGMTIKYNLNNKWSLLSGATYTQISNLISIQTMYAASNTANEIHFQYSTSNGEIEMPLDNIHQNLQVGDSINIKSVCKQSIYFVNVPLMLRIQLTKKKLTWYANGGFSANFILQEKAKININNSETTIINNINGLKKMNYGFLLGVGAQYNLKNDFGFFIEPMLRGSLSSITKNTKVNSYPYSLGLNLGFTLHF